MAHWIPILQPDPYRAHRAWEAIDAVADAVWTRNYLASSQQQRQHRGYEEALLYGYLALGKQDEAWLKRTAVCLNLAIDKVRELAHRPALYGGLCGLGWTLEHIAMALNEGFDAARADDEGAGENETPEDGDPAGEIDAHVLGSLRRGRWTGSYDLISGLVGIGTYFLERWPKGSAEEGILLVLDHIDAISERSGNYVTWHTAPELLPQWQREICPGGYYNLGVAHGIPGIIYFLSQVAVRGIRKERARRLLEGAVDWLMTQRRPSGSVSWFSGWVTSGPGSDSRLSWCYGDLGILAILLQVVRSNPRRHWAEFTRGLLEHCLAWPPGKAGAPDAGVCHGTAGIAHIFNRIYQSEGDVRFRNAALLWIERTLALRHPGSGVGGFSSYTAPNRGAPAVWEPSPAFLDGATGVALTLLSALTPVEPEWDRLLLISGKCDERSPVDPGASRGAVPVVP